MLKARLTAFVISVILGSLFLSSAVYAPWTTLGTGYAIKTNYHGIDVPPYTPVTATAGTLDSGVVNVTFRWHMPNDTVRWEISVPVWKNGTKGQWNNGTETFIWYANDTQTPDVIGDWGVQAFFTGPDGKDRANLTDVIKIKAESFNTVPEMPFGTIAAVVAMLIAFGLFIVKKKRIPRDSAQSKLISKANVNTHFSFVCIF